MNALFCGNDQHLPDSSRLPVLALVVSLVLSSFSFHPATSSHALSFAGLGPSVVPFSPLFWLGGFPTKIDKKKSWQCTLILTSLLDLGLPALAEKSPTLMASG